MELCAVRRLCVDRAGVARGLAEHGPGAGPHSGGRAVRAVPEEVGQAEE